MRSALLVAVLLALVVAVSVASAEPYVSVWEEADASQAATSSWFGNVGLIVTPSAYIPAPSAATVQWHAIDRDGGDVNIFGVNFGVGEWLELGAARVDPEGADAEEIGNVKVRVPLSDWLELPEVPSVAIGALDVSDEINRSLYFVLSKDFPIGDELDRRVSLHVGVGDNKTNVGALDGLFGGIEFAAFRYGLIQAEYDGDDFNAALRYNATPRFSLDVGTLDGDFGFGATYRSGF